MAECCNCPTCGAPLADDNLVVDLQNNVAIRYGQQVRLRPQEAELLFILHRRRPAVVSYDSIIMGIWSTEEPEKARHSLKVMLSHIRRKVAPICVDIRTSWGEGLYLATDEVRFRPKLLQGRPKLRDVA